MSEFTTLESRPGWQDLLLSFVPPAKRTSLARERLTAYRLPLILAVQAALTWRLSDIVSNDEGLYIQGGHFAIAYLLHGGAGNAAQFRFDGTFFSGAPAAYPVLAAALDSAGGLLLVRLFSLCCMLIATVCVYRLGRHMFVERVGLLAALTFALAGSVQYIGKLATFDAPCLVLVAAATMLAITKRSTASAVSVGLLLAVASVTKYVGLALVPFVLLMTFLPLLAAEGRLPGRNLRAAAVRGGVAALVFVVLLLGVYLLWGSSVAAGLKFTTTGRQALFPEGMSSLIKSLLDDIGLTYALTIGGIVLTLGNRRWNKTIIMAVMLGAGSVIQAGSLRIHEFTSLDKHTAFTALFCAVPAAVALSWVFSKRGRTILLALAALWLLLIDGMWRSNMQYSWPSSILTPVTEVKALNIPGLYFTFDSSTTIYYTEGDQGINWYPSAQAYSTLDQGIARVIKTEKSHKFTGFLFRTSDMSAGHVAELKVLDQLLAADPYYFETATVRVTPYTTSVWQLWIHYPVGYHGPKRV